jgi:hypothetical protein
MARRANTIRADAVIGTNLITNGMFSKLGHSTSKSNRAIKLSVLSRISISSVMAAALIVAPTYASTRTCITTDAPVQKACKPGCCANKACCATSKKNSAPISQPLAKNGSAREVNLAPVAAATTIAPGCTSLDRQFPLSRTRSCAIAQPQLAVLCTFLI